MGNQWGGGWWGSAWHDNKGLIVIRKDRRTPRIDSGLQEKRGGKARAMGRVSGRPGIDRAQGRRSAEPRESKNHYVLRRKEIPKGRTGRNARDDGKAAENFRPRALDPC